MNKEDVEVTYTPYGIVPDSLDIRINGRNLPLIGVRVDCQSGKVSFSWFARMLVWIMSKMPKKHQLL